MIGDRHQHFHDVLDHQHGYAARNDAPQQLDGIVAFRGRQTGHHLVEQQQRRFRRERPRDFEALLVGDGQGAPEPVPFVGEADEREHVVRVRDRVAQARPAQSAPVVVASSTVMSANVCTI